MYDKKKKKYKTERPRSVTAGFTKEIRLQCDETFNVWGVKQPIAVNTQVIFHTRDTVAFDNIKL